MIRFEVVEDAEDRRRHIQRKREKEERVGDGE